MLADALCDVTGVPEQFKNDSGQPPAAGIRAVDLYDVKARRESLAILGRC